MDMSCVGRNGRGNAHMRELSGEDVRGGICPGRYALHPPYLTSPLSSSTLPMTTLLSRVGLIAKTCTAKNLSHFGIDGF